MNDREKVKEIYEKEIKKVHPNFPDNLEELELDLYHSFDNPDTFKIDLLNEIINRIFARLNFLGQLFKPYSLDMQIFSSYLTQVEKDRLFEKFKDKVFKVYSLIMRENKNYNELLRDAYDLYLELNKIREEVVKTVEKRYKGEKSDKGSYVI